MTEIPTIGLDLAKKVFQVHGVDASGAVVVRRALRRSQVLTFFGKLAPCLIGMEACERHIMLDWHRSNASCRHLITIPGYGPITASAVAESW